MSTTAARTRTGRSVRQLAVALVAAAVGASGMVVSNAQAAPTLLQQAKLVASDRAAGDDLGASVAVSPDGNTALVGAYGRGSATGAVYVFTRSATGSWTQGQTLTASDATAGDQFGFSLALSTDGSTAIVGANLGNGSAGAAYVFTRSGTSWSQQREISASDAAPNDQLGTSVALSANGNTALLGALGKNAAYVFTRNGTTWSQQQEFSGSDTAAGDRFGSALALSSDGATALVGAWGQASLAGAAYVFTRAAAVWSQQQKVTASDRAASDFFGSSLALSGDGSTIAVGAPDAFGFAGAAYVYVASGGSWLQQQKLTASDGQQLDTFGSQMALSTNGNTALISASRATLPGLRGAAYLFARSGTVWAQQQKLVASDGADSDQFGSAIALSASGGTALVGAILSGGTGAAYAFALATTTTVSSAATSASIGDQVTYSATVSPTPVGGTVSFTDGAAPIAGCTALALTAGGATCQASYGAAGSHAVVAAFSGSASSFASTSPVWTQTVEAVAPVVTDPLSPTVLTPLPTLVFDPVGLPQLTTPRPTAPTPLVVAPGAIVLIADAGMPLTLSIDGHARTSLVARGIDRPRALTMGVHRIRIAGRRAPGASITRALSLRPGQLVLLVVTRSKGVPRLRVVRVAAGSRRLVSLTAGSQRVRIGSGAMRTLRHGVLVVVPFRATAVRVGARRPLALPRRAQLTVLVQRRLGIVAISRSALQ